MSLPPRRFFLPIALAIAAAALVSWVGPRESQAVTEHLAGFPQSDSFTHQLRPIILGAFFFLPALFALFYSFAPSLDRYLARQMLSAVGICTLALTLVWLLGDVQANLEVFKSAENVPALLLDYYGVTSPSVFVLLIPFALLLGLLYALGKLSNSREIIAMLQTGRGIGRVIAPLGTVGIFLSLACLGLNYHWAPWGEGYKDALLEYVRSGSASQATQVLYYHEDSRRTWFVGRFPYNYTQGEPLRDVVVRSKGEDNRPASVLTAPVAHWDKETRAWTFEDAVFLDLRATLPDGIEFPKFENLATPHRILDWPETPWQIVKPGLDKDFLGIPELKSWLNQHRDVEWSNRRAYLTRWYYRWSQPWICLVVVLLATPLGIVFTRRGTAGGIAVAVCLCAFMLLITEVSLALGDAGYIPPVIAAWGTNLIFAAVALSLLRRRFRGRPIYQTMKKVIPETE